MERVDQGYLDELVHEGLPSKGEVKVTTADVTWEDIHQNVDLIGKGDRDLDMKVTLQLLQVNLICCFISTVGRGSVAVRALCYYCLCVHHCVQSVQISIFSF